jgi:hypothetical protein
MMVSSATFYTMLKVSCQLQSRSSQQYGLGVTVTIPVVLAGALWWFQRRLIYPADFPEGSRTSEPDDFHLS